MHSVYGCTCAVQGILQGLELHNVYQVTVEFTRALRDAVKQLLRQYKFPEVCSSLLMMLLGCWRYRQLQACSCPWNQLQAAPVAVSDLCICDLRLACSSTLGAIHA